MLGEPLDAASAREAGPVTEIVPEPERLAAVAATARELAAKPSESLRRSKEFLPHALTPQIEAAIATEFGALAARLEPPEVREAFSAFFGKRPPDFSSHG